MITEWDEIDEQMEREAAAISRRFRSAGQIRRRKRYKDGLKEGEARVIASSGAGQERWVWYGKATEEPKRRFYQSELTTS